MRIYLKEAFLFFLLLLPGMIFAQAERTVIVQGTVTAESDGESLIAVNVYEVNPTNRVVNGTVTDFNGHYVVKVKDPVNNKLVFSYMGFKSQTVAIGSKRTINIKLEDESKVLKEAVVTAQRRISDGNFSVPQREIATAVQRLDAKEFEGIQVTSIDEALQGRIAGLDIVSNSGDLGSGTQMRIRGTTSINGNSEPLIVLNGVPYEVEVDQNFDYSNSNQDQYASMLSVNPDDILEITVLKDAAASAIWGAKGANGVISITTKKGAKGPTRVDYSYRLSRAVQPKGMNLLSGDEYSMLMKQAYFNPYQNESDADILPFNYDRTWSEYYNFNKNTDWVDAVTQTGWTNDHYLTVSGGGERATFRVSAGYLHQTGTIIGQDMKRLTTRANLDYSVSDRLKFFMDLSFTYSDNQRNYQDKNDGVTGDKSLLAIAYQKMPNVSIYEHDINGNNTGDYYSIPSSVSGLRSDQKNLVNPVALAYSAENRLKSYRVLPNFRLQYDFLDPEKHRLQWKAYVSFDINNSKENKYLPHSVSNISWDNKAVNRSANSDNESLTIQTDNNLTFVPSFTNPDHSLTVYASWQIRTGNSNGQSLVTFGLPTGDIVDASALGFREGMSTSRGSWRSMALMGQFHYAYKSRYIMSGTFRREGSTKFGNDRKWGNFPGISAKWIISDEPFMESTQGWLSMLALRPSWGRSGNQPKYEYMHFSKYASNGNYIDTPALKPTNVRLSDLRWEKSTSYNGGLDIGFFEDRLVFDANYYYRKIDDLLFENVTLPSTSGFGSLSYQNVGSMSNQGWELSIYGNKVVKYKDFSFDIRFNIADNRNEIISMDPRVLANWVGEFDYNNGSYITRIQEKHPFGAIYGFKYKGVYQYDKYSETEIPGVSGPNAPVARDVNGNVITDANGEPLAMMYAYNNESKRMKFRGGDAIYEDVNNDGSIDELDIVYLGNSNPKFNGGFGGTLRWKTLSVTAFFNFRYGNKIVNMARMNAENMYTNDNQSKAVNWRWRKDGDITDMPRALYNYGYNWLGSDRYVEDGSFLRFKYLTFNYSVPMKVLKPYKLNKLNFYLTINNLFCWTKYTGVDPEISLDTFGISYDKSKTPRTKDFTFGVSVGF